MYLVTGGAGFFGEILLKKLLENNEKATCFDIIIPSFKHPNLRVVQGDIRDGSAIEDAMNGVEIIHHNVAQVPIAKDINLFWSVNLDGMKILLDKANKQ
tara:strand:+ start:655 stop:951 length:297 start_codon:yes stop_codon:yes gene_type:complete